MPSAEVWLRDVCHSSFLGTRILQRWVDFVVWEKVLNAHPELKTVIELGTGQGAFSIYLLLQTIQRGMQFWTFDNVRFREIDASPAAIKLGLASHFYEGDIFGEGQSQLMRLLFRKSSHPLLLFCDNGDKPREIRTFIPLLQQGNIVGVHDWQKEFTLADIEPVRDQIESIFSKECQEIGSATRFWLIR